MAKDGSARTKWLVGTIIGLLGAGGGIVALLEYADRPSARMSELEINTDRYGADYSDFPSSDVDACASACLADEHCKAFSYNVAAKQCWLKADVSRRVDNAAFVSGVKLVD